MTTLGELREALFPSARPVGAPTPERAAATIGWVRVLRARTPALDVLEPGDVVIVAASALAVVAPGPGDVASLVGGLAAAPVAGVLVLGSGGGERVSGATAHVTPGTAEGTLGAAEAALAAAGTAEGTLGAAEAALAAAGVPAVVLTGAEPAAVERAVIGYLVNRRAEVDRQAAVLEDRLHALALAGADVEAFAGAIGGFLARAVAIEGRRGDALAVHAPADAPAAAADAAAYLSGSRAVALRVALPGSAGALAVLGEAPLGEVGRAACERVSAVLALELGRQAAMREPRDGARREPLPADGPPWVVLLARQGSGGPGDDIGRREAVRTEVRALAPARRLVLRGDALSMELRAVAAAPVDDPGALLLARRVSALLERTVAVSGPFDDPAGRPLAEAEARSTLEAALATREPRAVARAGRLPAYRLLGALHNLPDGLHAARSLLAPLLVGRPAAVRTTLATLRAVLEGPGPAEAAGALGVHRNTVLYRTRAIERRTGWDLRDPELRLTLLVALRIVQAAQNEGEETRSAGR